MMFEIETSGAAPNEGCTLGIRMKLESEGARHTQERLTERLIGHHGALRGRLISGATWIPITDHAKDKHRRIKSRAKSIQPSLVRSFPRAGSKAGYQQSRVRLGEAIHSDYSKPQSASSRRAGFAALASPAEVSRDWAMKPLPRLFKGVTRVAFSNDRSAAASPVMTTSVSERAQSVRPEQLGILRSRLSERQQPGASRIFPGGEVAFFCT
ncbi:uncharacterized protein GJ701_004065 [Geothlypis trichas]